jgi:hypothetical protein
MTQPYLYPRLLSPSGSFKLDKCTHEQVSRAERYICEIANPEAERIRDGRQQTAGKEKQQWSCPYMRVAGRVCETGNVFEGGKRREDLPRFGPRDILGFVPAKTKIHSLCG